MENGKPVARFPKPEVLSVELIDFDVLSEDSGWLNRIQPADRAQILRELREQMRAEAERSGLLDTVESYTAHPPPRPAGRGKRHRRASAALMLPRLRQRLVAQDFIQVRHPLPRAALALVFFPNHVAQLAPHRLRRRFQVGPSRVPLLPRRHDRPPRAEVVCPVKDFSLIGIFKPLVTFHAGDWRGWKPETSGESAIDSPSG